MAVIKTEKEAIEAVKNYIALKEIPDEYRKLESVTLAAVKADAVNLLYADIQTFEICLAAFQNLGDCYILLSEVLRHVDPELRTVGLLKSCSGFLVDGEENINDFINEYRDYDDEGLIEAGYDENWREDEQGYIGSISIHGKGDADWLFIAQKHLRRELESYMGEEFQDIWGQSPLGAMEYDVQFSKDKSSFKMTFHYGDDHKNINDFQEMIEYGFFNKGMSFYAKKLEIFLISDWEDLEGNGCAYRILAPLDDNKKSIKESGEWEYPVGGYKETLAPGELNFARMDFLKRRCELWLVEGSKDDAAIEKAKKALTSAEKNIVDKEKNWKLENDDNNGGRVAETKPANKPVERFKPRGKISPALRESLKEYEQSKRLASKNPSAPAEKKQKKGANMKKTTRNFIYSDEKTNKYWNIEVSGKSYTVNYGKVGAPKGQSTMKEFDSEEACQKAAGKVIKEKLGKGYVEK